jgi:single-strand DNA-binding protein
MALNLNHVQLAGHLTRDPQVRTLTGERCVAAFSLAINRRYKSADGEMKDEVTFLDCEAWGRTAELVGQYLTKGSPCYLDGRLKLESWQDKDGQKRSRVKVVVENVQFLGQRGQGSEATHDATSHDDSDEPVAPVTTSKTTRTPAKAASHHAGHAVGDNEPPF